MISTGWEISGKRGHDKKKLVSKENPEKERGKERKARKIVLMDPWTWRILKV